MEGIWKESVISCFKMLPRYLSGKTEENNENFSEDGRPPGRDLKWDLSHKKEE
jgi:hypothetical protein